MAYLTLKIRKRNFIFWLLWLIWLLVVILLIEGGFGSFAEREERAGYLMFGTAAIVFFIGLFFGYIRSRRLKKIETEAFDLARKG